MTIHAYIVARPVIVYLVTAVVVYLCIGVIWSVQNVKADTKLGYAVKFVIGCLVGPVLEILNNLP